MGAWGYEPRKNDTALDYEIHVFGDEGRPDLGPQDPDEQRYVAWLLTKLHHLFPGLKDLARVSLARLTALLENEEWIAIWENREAIEASLKQQITDLQRIINRP